MSQEVQTKWFHVNSNDTIDAVMKEADKFLKTLDEKKSYNVYARSDMHNMYARNEDGESYTRFIIVEYFDYHSCGESWDYLATNGGCYDEDDDVVEVLKVRKACYDAMMEERLYVSTWDYREYKEPEGYGNLFTPIYGKYRADLIEVFEDDRKRPQVFSLDEAIEQYNALSDLEKAIFLIYTNDGYNIEEALNRAEGGDGDYYITFEATFNRSQEAYKIDGAFKNIGEELANYYDIFADVPESCQDLINYFDYDAYGYSIVRYEDYQYFGYYRRDESDGTLYWQQGTVHFF